MVRLFCLTVAAGLLSLPGVGVSSPFTSSPGDPANVSLVAGVCPTFSWGTVPGAESYELVLYDLEDEPSEVRPLLQERLPGSVNTWTPELGRCPVPGGRYAWALRAFVDGSATGWSDIRFFEVSASPPVDRIEDALALLERYLEVDRDGGSARRQAAPRVLPEGPAGDVGDDWSSAERGRARTASSAAAGRREGEEDSPRATAVVSAPATVAPTLVLGTGGILFPDGSLQTRAPWKENSLNSQRIAGSALRPRESGVSYTVASNGGCTYVTAGDASAVWNVPVDLPQGARVDTLRMYYYDTSASNTTAWFTVYDLYGSIVDEWSVSSTTSSGNSFNDSSQINHVVDHSVYSYLLNWRPVVAGSTIQLCGFRIFFGA